MGFGERWTWHCHKSGGGVALQVHHSRQYQRATKIEWRIFHEKREFFNFLKLHQMSSSTQTHSLHHRAPNEMIRCHNHGVILMIWSFYTWSDVNLAWFKTFQWRQFWSTTHQFSIQFSLGGFTWALELVITTVVLTCRPWVIQLTVYCHEIYSPLSTSKQLLALARLLKYYHLDNCLVCLNY